jgi:glycosyltransferase involved in cell wall biosynthesis
VIRVASVPESHVYVQHLTHPDVSGVVRLLDPVPADGRKVPGGWWPPLMFEPGWVDGHHGEFDVFHVHFGFDALTPDDMTQVLAALRRHGKPLVYTVHDLRNPHHSESAAHVGLLDLLIPAADAVVTLTPGAADEIRRRWDRDSYVLPHPHVVPRPWLEAPRHPHDGFLVGIHMKSLRASMDPIPVIDALANQVTAWPEATLQVNVHDEIFDPDHYWYAPNTAKYVRDLVDAPQVDVRIHPYFSDDDLWKYLASLDVSVLPYRFGTHSGWLEACYDLGTGVVAPDCGFYAEQRPCSVFSFGERTPLDTGSLVRAVASFRGAPPSRPTWPQRLAERKMLAQAHVDIYTAVL